MYSLRIKLPVTLLATIVTMTVALFTWQPAEAVLLAEGDAPLALSKPTDINCRPLSNNTDQVVVRWKDTNNGAADYKVYRRATTANSWTLMDTVLASSCDGDDICAYTDTNASNSTIYRYRVDADDGVQPVVQSDVCREPLWVDSAGGNYRTFFRLVECPDVDGQQICTQDISTPSPNKHAVQLNDTHEDYRDEWMGLGFNDPGTINGGKPFPIDLYYCNNGCANSNGIQIPPDNMEAADYNPATGTGNSYEVFVVGHEEFHKVQGSHGGGGGDPDYKWLIEGQARSTEDKSCIFPSSADCTLWDDQDVKYYASQVRSYLGAPEQALLKASYNAALFWTYVTEQFGASTTEPQRGMDFMLKFWQMNESLNASKNGIDTLNDTLAALNPATPRRFKDIFQDFAVANYAKDYITNPVPNAQKKYNYIDEETYPGLSYGLVKKTVSGPLAPDQAVVGLTSVQAWATRYFEVDPDPTLPAVNIEVEALAGTSHELYFHVLAIEGGAIVNQWSDLGTEFELNVDNGPDYDRLALVVASMGQAVNFNYGFNLADGLFIQSPTTLFPAAVGETTSPKKFLLEFQVLDDTGDPVPAIDSGDFTITVGSQVISPPANPADDPIVGSSYIAGNYWLVVRAPDNPGCDPCDLSVAYTEYSDTETDALDYGPVPDTDNMIIIDRSGSMAGTKIDAAKEAGRLYVDSYSDGDRVGVLSFNENQNLEYALTTWSDPAVRTAAQTAINSIAAPVGQTAIGAALREGQQELIDQASPNPAWAMVLLSDGEDTVADTDDHIPAFLSEYKSRKDDGDQVPVMHVVAIGDDADGVALEKVAAQGNGLFQFLPEPSGVAAAEGAAANAVDTKFYGTLAEIYRVFAEDVLDEQQIYARQVISSELKPFADTIPVDKSASEAVFVVKYYPSNATTPFVALTKPSGGPAIPPTLVSQGQLLWRLPAPEAGDWTVVLRGVNTPPNVFLVESALVSDLILKGYLGLPPEERIIGKAMPVLAHLSDIDPLIGATVKAKSERTGEVITLHDDGQHGDGAKDDGFYGGTLVMTNQEGGYPRGHRCRWHIAVCGQVHSTGAARLLSGRCAGRRRGPHPHLVGRRVRLHGPEKERCVAGLRCGRPAQRTGIPAQDESV